MKKLLLALAGGMLLTGCIHQPVVKSTTPTGTGEKTPVVTQEPAKGNEVMTPKTVTLAAVKNSGQTGTATLKEVNGKVMVSLSLTGVKSVVAQPAHIHTGTCAKPGDVKYPLTDVVNGKSETTLNMDMATLEVGGDLLVNVHKSAKELAVYMACGNL